jgi:hypothetical protein
MPTPMVGAIQGMFSFAVHARDMLASYVHVLVSERLTKNKQASWNEDCGDEPRYQTLLWGPESSLHYLGLDHVVVVTAVGWHADEECDNHREERET